jgi:HEAT repeat protein
MGSSAATPEFLTRIAELLEDEDWGVRIAAAWAVESMGSSAATPEFLTRIAELLEDEDRDVRLAAARAVEAMLDIRLFRRGSTLTAERLATLTDPTR